MLVSAAELAEIGITNPWQQVISAHGRVGTDTFPHPAMNSSGNYDISYAIYVNINNPQITVICGGAYSSRMVCIAIDYIDID